MRTPTRLTILAGLLVLVGAGLFYGGRRVLEGFEANQACCQMPAGRNLLVTLEELLGVEQFPSEIGQDKWVLETMFPGVADGYFVDVGSGHGRFASNSWALERHGWTGVCIDPFPVEMEGRTCRMFREVVFSDPPRQVTFQIAGWLGGVTETLGKWNDAAAKAPSVTFTTTTLRDILARAQAPAFIHFVSLDIEGAELEALEAFPFDTVRVGAWAIEHNQEEPKRSDIRVLLERHGYRRVHTFKQDDFYAPGDAEGS